MLPGQILYFSYSLHLAKFVVAQSRVNLSTQIQHAIVAIKYTGQCNRSAGDLGAARTQVPGEAM